MAEKNLTLTQVADRLATLGYMISMEGDEIAPQDLYAMAGDLESSIAAILAAAKQKETEGA